MTSTETVDRPRTHAFEHLQSVGRIFLTLTEALRQYPDEPPPEFYQWTDEARNLLHSAHLLLTDKGRGA